MKQALRDLTRLPRCIGSVTHGNNARRHQGLGIWRTRSLLDQEAAGCSYRQSAISRLPGAFPPTWAQARLRAAASMRMILEREAEFDRKRICRLFWLALAGRASRARSGNSV